MNKLKITMSNGEIRWLDNTSEGINIFYAGVMFNGQPYASSEAPVHAGVYEVTAQYTTRDELNRVINLGIGVGAMVIEPSKSDTTVDNAAYPYGSEYKVGSLVHASSVNVPGLTPDTTVISAGISTNLDNVTGLDAINGTVNVDLPSWMDELFNKLGILEAGYANGISAQTFLNYVAQLRAGLVELGVDTASFDKVVSLINQLPITTNLTFKDNIGYTEVGAYLVLAVVTDSDHYPSFGAGIMVIYPNATQVELKFEEDWNDNNIFTWHALSSMNLEAKAYLNGASCADADKKVVNLYFGFTDSGEFMFEAVTYGENIKDVPEFRNGLYTQLALVNDFGNVMYYAKPISRAFAIIPTPATVEFIDEKGDVNANRLFTFDNTQHAMAVRVTLNGVVVENPTVTITYVGVQTNGVAYNSTEAPVHAGTYVVTATYTTRDELDRLVTLGAAVGAMVIKPATAEIDVTNTAEKYVQGNKHDTSSMVVVKTDIEGITPDKTVITAMINTNGSFSENGLDAIVGAVNMDLPKWLDDVIANYNIFTDGLTPAEFIAGVETVKAKLEEIGIDASVFDGLVKIASQFPQNASISFKNQTEIAPEAVGAYLVIGVVTDSDFYPAMDAGILVIYPAITEATLEWKYEDSNNIFALDTLDKIDLGATSTPEVGALLKTLFLGVDASEWSIKLVDNQKVLDYGIYTEFAFVNPNVDSVIYYAVPIARTIVILPNAYNISIGGQTAVHEFDNTGKDMGEITMTNLSGESVTYSPDSLRITYVGIDSLGRPYYSTEKPVNVGTYTVIAAYIGTDADGDRSIGMAVGSLIITPADVDIEVNSHAGLYGQDYDFELKLSHNAINDAPKTLVIVAGLDMSAYTTEGKIGIDGTINVDFPEVIDNILKGIFPDLYTTGIGSDLFFERYNQMVAASPSSRRSTKQILHSRITQSPPRPDSTP